MVVFFDDINRDVSIEEDGIALFIDVVIIISDFIWVIAAILKLNCFGGSSHKCRNECFHVFLNLVELLQECGGNSLFKSAGHES